MTYYDKKYNNRPYEKKRPFGFLRPVGQLVPQLTKKIFSKRGLNNAAIITDWQKIIGTDLARHSQPDRLIFPKGERNGAILHIKVEGALATQMQHMEVMVIDRVNSYFGYKAVAEIRLSQTSLPREKVKIKKILPPITKDDANSLDKKLDNIEDPAMKEILKKLGTAILRRQKAIIDD